MRKASPTRAMFYAPITANMMLRGSLVSYAPDEPAAAPAPAASLYPADGGAAAAAAPAGEATTAAPAGNDTVAGGSGTDTVAAGTGADTTSGGLGTDTVAGGETTAGNDTQSGQDTQSGTDVLTADSYKFNLPDGVSVDETALTSLKTTLAEAKVSPEVAQSLLDMHVKQLEASGQAFTTQQKAAWDSTIEGWKTAINSDPELGGDKRAAVTSNIAKALDEYGDAKTRAAFDLTGSGWNPDIIRFVNRMATALSEGKPHAAGGPSGAKPSSVGAALYPDPQT